MWMESFPVRPEVRVRQGLRLRKKNYYILRVSPSPESTAILKDLSLFPTDTEFSAIDLKKTDCQRLSCGEPSWAAGPSISPRAIITWNW